MVGYRLAVISWPTLTAMIMRYSRPEMRAIWTDENRLKIWLEIEMLASAALVKEGIVPKADFAKMKRGAENALPTPRP